MATKKDPREARALVMFKDGRSREEIAEKLGLTVTETWACTAKPTTVKQRANQKRVLERLRKETANAE